VHQRTERNPENLQGVAEGLAKSDALRISAFYLFRLLVPFNILPAGSLTREINAMRAVI